MQTVRLTCSWFWVDLRINDLNGRWIASADLPDGPSLGIGTTPREAIAKSLVGFEDAIDELLASAPADLLDRSGMH